MGNNKMIRVLQVGMSPYYGGTESFIMNQYRAIDKKKVQFDFLNVYQEKIACQDEIEALGGRIYYLNMARHQGLKTYYKHLDCFFAKYAVQFDVVHCNYQSLINVDILIYAKKYGIKVRIAHAHNAGYGTEPSLMQKMLISRNKALLQKYATDYFACSSLAADWMFGREATVINNAIDVEKFSFSEDKRQQIRDNMGLDNCFTIIFVGRLDPQKNPIFLLDIFHEIKKIRSDAKLLVVGDGVLREKMTKRISCYSLENSVLMLGSRSDVNELLQAADVFLMPSKFEGLGIVLIEAQAAGLKTYTSANVVPKEVKITQLLEFIPLEKSAEDWAKIIVALEYKRICTTEVIKKNGYNNAENAKKLEQRYIHMVENSL